MKPEPALRQTYTKLITVSATITKRQQLYVFINLSTVFPKHGNPCVTYPFSGKAVTHRTGYQYSVLILYIFTRSLSQCQ